MSNSSDAGGAAGNMPVVFVVDDDASVRKALTRVLRAAGLAVRGFASAKAYLAEYDAGIPGCLVLDLSMPEVSGLQLQDVLTARGDAPPIIFLTGRAEVPDSVQAMKRGAVEFLTKPVDGHTLIDAVHSALERDRVDRIARGELADIHRRLALLTQREREVLAYIISGKLNKQTAADLGTVEKTIKVHRAHIMEKMQVASLAELVQLATRAGIKSAPRN